MKFFNFKKQKLKPEIKSGADIINLPAGSFLEYALGGYGSRINAGDAMNFYRNSSAVATAIDVIADEIEMIKPVIELKDGSLISEHPILTLLESPNDFEDYRSFIGQLARHWLLTHECFIYAEGSLNRLPRTLFAINPFLISPMQDAIDGYPRLFSVSQGMGLGTYNREKGKFSRFLDGNLRELFHVMGFSSRTDQTTPDSPLEAAAIETRQQILGRNHNLKVIQNGGRISLAFVFKDTMSQEDHDIRKQAIYNQFAGSNNAGNIAVFSSEDMEIKEMGLTSKDMDFSGLDRIATQSIYMRYKIPLPIVNADSQTYSNFERAILDLYDRAILPNAEIIFSGLTKFFKLRVQDDNIVRITYNPEDIVALRSRMLAEIKLRREINIETVNELRENLPDREPIEGGDIFYQAATLVPAGRDLFQNDPVTAVDDENIEY